MYFKGNTAGDPLGPALFALSIHPAIKTAQEVVAQTHPGKLDFVAFYLDGGTVAGDAEAVQLFARTFEAEIAALGLSLSESKCEVVPAAGPKLFILR